MRQTSRRLICHSPLGTIIFHSQVIETFNKLRQTDSKKQEAGGQLFASLRDGTINVLRATSPSSNAARGRYFFRPNRKEEQKEIKAAFEKELHFIGDWHTHPELEPSPSNVDLVKASKIFKRSKHELRGLLMIIVGTASFPIGLWAGWITADGIKVIQPEIVMAPPDEDRP